MGSETVSFLTMADDIRMIYGADPSTAEHVIENYIAKRLKGCPASEKMRLLEQLIDEFGVKRTAPRTREGEHAELGELSRLLSLVLGERASTINLSSPELMEKVTVSLNTLFDTLNEIVRVINSALLGDRIEEKTIRRIIGSELQGENDHSSLQAYLNRIRVAFLVAHGAFQQAAQTKMRETLSKLDPENIASGMNVGLKFGPLRKAALFDAYVERFQACNRWLESGRLVEEFLREFEKICEKAYTV
jgi:hypothetical protein